MIHQQKNVDLNVSSLSYLEAFKNPDLFEMCANFSEVGRALQKKAIC